MGGGRPDRARTAAPLPMKKAPLLLAASLAGNVVLVGLFLTRPPAAPDRSSPLPARPAGRIAASPPSVGAAARARSDRIAKALGEPMDTTGARELAARMRAAGFPEDLVRAAAQARLVEQFRARSAEIQGVNEPVPPFWDVRATSDTDPVQQAALRALSRQMDAAMKETLGADYRMFGLSGADRASLQREYGEISLHKIIQIQEIMQESSLQQAEVYGNLVGGYSVRLPEDAARLAEIEKERRAAIVALLSPAELEQYDLRASSTALTLRNQLIAFEPTEDEYLRLFRLQQAFDEKYPASAAAGDMNQILERSRAQQQLRQDMAAALPPDRREAYSLLTEGSATTVARLVNRLDLPMSTVAQVMTVQREIQAQANAVRVDPTLSVETRNQALAALQQQAGERIAGHIGANGLAAYRTSAGAWITNLLPPAAPARGGASR
jgi:hypothetical protein